MGGVAALAGALGPTIGGVLTSVFSWRAVLLINLPLLVLTLFFTLRSVPGDRPHDGKVHVDLSGAVLLCFCLVGLVFGLAQSTVWDWTSAGVIGPVVVSVAAGVLFVLRERRAHNPLMSLRLLREKPNYLGATLSQGLAGMAEMGLGLIFPLVLILNLQMDPALAGLALIPTTLPMVVMAPLAGRWYDRGGGRPPIVTGFCLLAVSGVALAIGVGHASYWWLLPGLLIYGTGLAIVLTVNDPVSLDTVPESDQGQASGVSATAEQGGGAIGIALLYALFHTAYLTRLNSLIDADSTIPNLDAVSGSALKQALLDAEQTGLRPDQFEVSVRMYLKSTASASEFGYSVTFLAVTVLSLIGAFAVALLVRKPPALQPEPAAGAVRAE
jgi:MFS family permease